MTTHFPHHNTVTELEDYCDGRLSDEAIEPVERHLSECSDCREIARSMAAVADVFDRWSAALTPNRILPAAIKRAHLRSIGHTDRLKQWERKLRAAPPRSVSWSGAIVRVTIGVDDSQSSLAGGLRISVTRQPRGAKRTGAVRTEGGAAGGSEVEVFVDNLQTVKAPPLVLLIPKDERFDPIVADVEVGPEQTGVARFQNVAVGDYVIAVEPVE